MWRHASLSLIAVTAHTDRSRQSADLRDLRGRSETDVVRNERVGYSSRDAILCCVGETRRSKTMTTYRDSQQIPVARERLFDLVADVERYPEFLSLWKNARVYDRPNETTYFTEQEIGLGPLQERFRTKTVMKRPDTIEVTSHDGLFRTFRILWTFTDLGVGERPSCRADVALTWQVRSWLMQRAIDVVLPETARSMVQAFARRARRPRPLGTPKKSLK